MMARQGVVGLALLVLVSGCSRTVELPELLSEAPPDGWYVATDLPEQVVSEPALAFVVSTMRRFDLSPMEGCPQFPAGLADLGSGDVAIVISERFLLSPEYVAVMRDDYDPDFSREPGFSVLDACLGEPEPSSRYYMFGAQYRVGDRALDQFTVLGHDVSDARGLDAEQITRSISLPSP